jgi:ubiquinol-cytochrome c reductase iron-sulfur subunit
LAHADDTDPQGTHGSGTRRDFIYYATAGAAAVTAGAAVWPLANQMNPSADVQALASIQVDVAGVAPGTQITVLWQGRPVFIRARTEEEIAAAREVDVATLIDPLANNANLGAEASAADENRALAPFEGDANPPGTWLVQMGVCTHLGCVPIGQSGDFGGWFCPCHGSHYDTAGRIRQGPAPRNLPIPVAAFVDPATIQLG